MNESPSPLEIGAASPHEVDAALALAFGPTAREQADAHAALFRDRLDRGTPTAEGIQVAWRAGRLVGAALFQIQPGRTAVVWPPRLVEGEARDTAVRLLGAAAAEMARRGVRLASVLLEQAALDDEQVLRTAGFSQLADLLYLVSFEQDFPVTLPPTELTFEVYSAENRERFERVVEETYVESLDCAGLDGVRTMDDVLAGYRAAGAFSPERWLLIHHLGRDIGCLLLTDHREEENWELVYMGLIEPARGRGRGLEIVRRAQWLTRRAGRPRLVLAVDAANRPALQMYGQAGFQAWDRRRVYVRVLAAP